jgi:predicted metalloprotease
VRWKRVPGAGDVEDRRGSPGSLGGLPFPIPLGRAGGGGIGVLLLVALVYFLAGGNLGGSGNGSGLDPLPQAPGAAGASVDKGDDTAFEFVKFVSKDTQDFWAAEFSAAGETYERATVVVFTGGTQSACGPASEATGPFYCPLDHKVYLDLGFFRELDSRFDAPGDFAQAYVVAHELGHHVQSLLGIESDVRGRQQDDPSQQLDLSVRLELQADCLAGVWGHSAYARNELQAGDLEEALGAAAAVGDDRLQKQAGQSVNPETWTHGSSAQRSRWFRTGFDSGDPDRCDTFGGDI